MEHQTSSATGFIQKSPSLISVNQGPPRNAMSPPLYRKSTPGSLQPSPRILQAESIRRSQSAVSMSPSISLSSQFRHGELLQSIEPRPMPSRDFSDETIDDAYVDFIFYCNPGVPASTNTSELRRMFRSPPKSDGKSFSIYTLWELIQKLDRKELKTWIQLAIELGVEPPLLEKKQSTQKVQQYAVRLKRWMRAMHVDAFFDYCLGHPHPYYNSRVSNDHEEDIADAVPKEEDLALRALFPEWKPKKGRKKAMDELRPSKKSRLDTQNVGAHTGNSTYAPWSAMPDDFEQHDDWGTNSVFSTSGRAENVRHTDPSQACQRWDFSGPPQRSSPLRYPQSAVIPRFKNQDVLFEREPRSAITPNSTNRLYYNRSFDQPAIRSWIPPREVGSDDSSNQQQLDTSNGGNPTVTLCPGMTMAYEPSLGQANCDPLCAGSNNHEVTGNAGREPNGSFVHPTATVSRPVKLQLQVPRGSPKPPIRLATPQLLINGEFRQPSTFIETQTLRDVAGQRIHNAQDSHDLHSGASLRPNIQTPLQSSAFPNSIAHMFSHDIQRGRVSDGSALSEKNASAIAEAIIKQIISQCSPNCSSETLVVYCATYLGLGSQLGLGSRREGPLYIKILPEEGPTPRFRDMDSIPTPSTALDKSAYSRSRTQCIINYDLLISPGFTMKTTIHVTVFLDLRTHTKSSDSLHVDRTTRNKLPTALEDSDEELLLAGSGVDWKQRYLNLKRQIRKRDAALKLYKKNILEAVMDDI